MTNALQMCKDYLRNAKTPNDVEGHILMEMTPIRDGRSFKRDKSRHQSVLPLSDTTNINFNIIFL